ncbi:hypothetical protein BDB00DRAFT_839838 [Zychaea mexicana]|uniref:uncharacterized protein n=1 Tax=Zychaea mexicana TaxID=64656 RepID=UPI0022FE3EC2|nr:uncharacterized protein BDB00DRAFT_839838 [Zychaea mexicana]KAI9490036.1 hypothetical protein BDB00DRAFT_839838 [Zychaea mexicana]
MSAYDNVSKGSLKFKGGESGSIKKKKKKSKSDKEKVQRAIREDSAGSGSDSNKKKLQRFTLFDKTEAEKKFEETQRRRQMERVAKAAAKSHKEKVAEFNNKLEDLSEHHDIPKVGPG